MSDGISNGFLFSHESEPDDPAKLRALVSNLASARAEVARLREGLRTMLDQWRDQRRRGANGGYVRCSKDVQRILEDT